MGWDMYMNREAVKIKKPTASVWLLDDNVQVLSQLSWKEIGLIEIFRGPQTSSLSAIVPIKQVKHREWIKKLNVFQSKTKVVLLSFKKKRKKKTKIYKGKNSVDEQVKPFQAR